MSLTLPNALEAEIGGLVARYPQPRSAAVMVLHALQDHFGFLSAEAIAWTAARLGVQPIQILELVTFYPMFRRQPVGRFHLRLCRTLSCALSGSHALHGHLCRKLGLDPNAHGPQTTADGRFTVEFVECLASCATGPVLLCNDRFHEKVTPEHADALVAECERQGNG
jgi:NADH-quinone oxidoreductase subunit E